MFVLSSAFIDQILAFSCCLYKMVVALQDMHVLGGRSEEQEACAFGSVSVQKDMGLRVISWDRNLSHFTTLLILLGKQQLASTNYIYDRRVSSVDHRFWVGLGGQQMYIYIYIQICKYPSNFKLHYQFVNLRTTALPANQLLAVSPPVGSFEVGMVFNQRAV